MKTPTMTEGALHLAVARYLELALPPTCFFTTFPAGGGGRIRGAQLKARGLKPGLPDLMILRPSNLYGSTQLHWIELKRPRKGVTSLNQKLCHARLIAAGCQVAICRSIGDVQEALIGWGISVRARAA